MTVQTCNAVISEKALGEVLALQRDARTVAGTAGTAEAAPRHRCQSFGPLSSVG